MHKRIVLLVFLGITLSACSTTVGPRTIPRTRADYNQALVRSLDEQLLLNLVRLRYRDNPMFLEVSSITASYLWTGGTSASTGIDSDGKTTGAGVGVDLRMSEAPTISYVPLQGEEFARRLLTPLSHGDLVSLSQLGWSIERLLLCCVQQINGIPNALAATGPTPEYVPEFREFHQVARVLRELQVAGFWTVEIAEPEVETENSVAAAAGSAAAEDASAQKDQKEAAEPSRLVLRFRQNASPELAEKEAEARRLLHLNPTATEFGTTPRLHRGRTEEISITGRPLLGVLFLLSQAVEVPRGHESKVTQTKNPDRTPFDWHELTGPLFRVQTSPERPQNAAVAVRYRDHWFWIADDDLNSKSTFNLLTYLFLLQTGQSSAKEPLLTLGVR